jgi:hypothetical protein
VDRSAGSAVERNDYMIANVVVAKISMPAATSTPVYFSMTGAAAPGVDVEVGVTLVVQAGAEN